MREESHLEDMRSALRGDFARLAERRGEQGLLRMADEPEEVDANLPPEALAEQEVAREEPQRSWFARFVSP